MGWNRNAYKNRKYEIEDIIVQKDRRIDYWKQRFNNCENRRRILTIEVQTLQNDIQRLQNENQRLCAERDTLRNRIENTHDENQGLHTKMQALWNQNQTLQTNNQTLTEERDEFQRLGRIDHMTVRILNRQKEEWLKKNAALRILVQQLQIRNMNPPINIPPININLQPNIIWLPLW